MIAGMRAQSRIWRAAACAVLGWFALSLAALASEPPPTTDIANLQEVGLISPQLEVARGIPPDMTAENVVGSAADLGFQPAPKKTPHFSSREGSVWFRFSVNNSSPDVQSAKLAIRFSYLERVELYEVRPDGSLLRSTAGSAATVTGNGVAAAYPAFHLLIPANERRDYYIRVQTDSIIVLPVTLSSEAEFAQRVAMETLLWSLIVGAALAFATYAASISLKSANGAFRIYVLFALSTALYILLSSGLLNALIGRTLDFNFSIMVYFAQALTLASGTLFIITFLEMKKQAPRLHQLFYGIIFISVLTGVSFLLPDWMSTVSYIIATGAGPVLISLGLGWMAFQGVSGARSVLIAWLPCLLATVWIYLRIFDLTPYIPINHFLLPLAFAFTLAYLSAVLGGKVRQAEYWANTDAITGLGNRRLLESICELESRQTSERYSGALAIDLDRFKPVNDSFGHAAGDAVLVAVAGKIRTHFGGRADIFRTGGDEFIILCYHWQSRMEIITQANALLKSMDTPIPYEGHYLSVGASIGIAFHNNRASFEDMLRQADAELYHVKSSGRGAIRIADQRKRDRRSAEPVIFADNDDDTDERVARMFGTFPRR